MDKRNIWIAGLALCWLGTAEAAAIDDSMTIVEAIDSVRESGVEIVYSSKLVKAWMRVRQTPDEDDSIAALRHALSAYELDLEAGPGDKWLVVRSEAPTLPTRAEQVTDAVEPAPVSPVQPALDEIRIIGSRHSMFDRRGVTDQFLNGDEIRQMPHIADDSFRALHRLPGVAANDFQAPFNLRGGASGEVKVQLDGLEISEPFHMRTLFQPLSIIDPGIIEEAQLLSGGFTAEHGNHTSGVIDISTRRPPTAPAHEVGVSFVSAFARSGGQFAGGRGNYFISGRRGYLDLITERLVEKGEELKPRYGDLYARISYLATDALDLSLQTLLAEDDVAFVDNTDGEDFGENSGRNYVWLTAEFEPLPGVQSTSNVFWSRAEILEDGSQIDPPAQAIFRTLDTEIDEVGAQSDWLLPLNDRQILKFGARYRETRVDYDYLLNSTRQTDFVNNSIPFFVNYDIDLSVKGEDYSAYGAWRVRASERWVWELGVRWDRQNFGDESDDEQLSPRVNALFSLDEDTDLRIAWGVFHQPHMPEELYIADGDTRRYGIAEAQHFALGLRHEFESGVQLQADIYDKDYRSIRPRYESLLDVYEFAPESNFDRAFLAPDSGRAYGAEFTLRSRNESRLDWWLSYSWSKVTDDYSGTSVYRSWDQRHALTASLTWYGEKWTLSAVGRFRSGWPRTPLIAEPVFDNNGNIIGADLDLTEWNSRRFDDYSRVDIRASRQVALERGSFEYYFELFNVFDTKNDCCTKDHTFSIGPGLSVAPSIDEYLPLFPSFGFVWKFGAGVEK